MPLDKPSAEENPFPGNPSQQKQSKQQPSPHTGARADADQSAEQATAAASKKAKPKPALLQMPPLASAAPGQEQLAEKKARPTLAPLAMPASASMDPGAAQPPQRSRRASASSSSGSLSARLHKSGVVTLPLSISSPASVSSIAEFTPSESSVSPLEINAAFFLGEQLTPIAKAVYFSTKSGGGPSADEVLQRFEITEQELGRGAFGTVCLKRLQERKTGRIVHIAQKHYRRYDVEHDLLMMMRKVDAPVPDSIIKTSRVCEHASFFLPYMEAGSLHGSVNDVRSAIATESQQQVAAWFVYRMLTQILQGLEYLHQHQFNDYDILYEAEQKEIIARDRKGWLASPLIHHDLKAHNILLQINPAADDVATMIGGFGSAQTVYYSQQWKSSGTLNYFSPEKALRQQEVDDVVLQDTNDLCRYDVWSLGILLHRLLGITANDMLDPYKQHDGFSLNLWAKHYLGYKPEYMNLPLPEWPALAERFADHLTCLERLRGHDYTAFAPLHVTRQILLDLATAMVLPEHLRPTSQELHQLCQAYQAPFAMPVNERKRFIADVIKSEVSVLQHQP